MLPFVPSREHTSHASHLNQHQPGQILGTTPPW
ncbi:hypothetical protein ABH940_007099 [Streptacidiphilus sp. BW17]